MSRVQSQWSRHPIIAVTVGDMNGIGPEIALKSATTKSIHSICQPLLVGPISVFEFYKKRLRISGRLEEISELPHRWSKGVIPVWNPGLRGLPRPQSCSATSGTIAGKSLLHAARLCLHGSVDGVVTAPVSKHAMDMGGFHYPGQTEMLAHICGSQKVVMMLIAGSFRVGLATVHLPLRKVAENLSVSRILEKLEVVSRSLKTDFNIRSPRIALLALNPHAGEDGLLGSEERKILRPVLEKARNGKIHVEGPFPADGFFGRHSYREYDAVLAMYHDQGLIPLKMAGFRVGVNFSAGLPIVRTSPDHGTAFDLAGKGMADPSSMIAAIKLAVSIIRNRRRRL